ncbi:ribosomal protein-alanine acetyltransferase RimI-like protein [Myxozyma melibiosi]|uniref:Ribosomal protein-alanine acetyltransferase RimI-like protein n=1 Tax=Myxozyma melibiosi TaxID=54550 RepID=A0ABR1FCN5_9ASCO
MEGRQQQQPVFLPLLPLVPDEEIEQRSRVLRIRIDSFCTRDLDAVRQFLSNNLPLTYSNSFLLQFITARESRMLIARHASTDAIVGIVGGRFVHSLADRRICHGHIMILAVAEQCRRSGVGRILLQKLESKLRSSASATVKTSFLEVSHTNAAAIKFYQNEGYSIEKREKGYYNGKVDALIMRKYSLATV